MKTIIVQQTYYTIPELYRAASGSKARRGLAGYMIKTGCAHDTVFGGAMYLLCALESLGEHEVYTLDKRETYNVNKEITSLAEAALAGCFHKRYELPQREVQNMLQAFDELPPLDR